VLTGSSDEGRTWSGPRHIGLGMAQVPGLPLRLADGRLMLVHGKREFPFASQVIARRGDGHTGAPSAISWGAGDLSPKRAPLCCVYRGRRRGIGLQGYALRSC